jgi:glycosyltransferase involved in cell wall biosynthesis
MIDGPLASVVVNNYNYGRFLREAVDSALAQTYPNTEVIVVDDGSTDDSRAVLARYQDRVHLILKENGGQTSALNAGFQACRGNLVVFLDADDCLLPSAVEQAASAFVDPQVVQVHWPLLEINGASQTTGKIVPAKRLTHGDLRDEVIRHGPEGLICSPTSGNAWRSGFLKRHFPMPVLEKKCGAGSAAADARLSVVAPLYGRVAQTAEPQGCYRVHGQNDYAAMPFVKKLAFDRVIFDELCDLLATDCARLGLPFDAESTKQRSWLYRRHQAVTDVTCMIPPGTTVILVDDDTWGIDHSLGIRAIPFLEQGGQYAGAPPDDATAIRELERLQQSGAEFIVFAWSSFWWLDSYAEFHHLLRERHACPLANDRVVIFELQ